MKPSLTDRLAPTPPKRLLALDGGGIRGLISLEFLARMEEQLRARSGGGLDVLADYFDYIGGTSTGAIIAAGLSLGMRVDELTRFYISSGAEMFDKASWIRRFNYKYDDERLAAKLRDVFGAETTLGDERLRTLLLVVLRSATTDSPWPLSNNPRAKYNDLARSDSNLRLPLWQIVRASTAAPTYFPPEVVQVGRQSFVFQDGGVTMYNNPALQLFLMATLDEYRLGWPTGEDRMLLVSVGTGAAADANANLAPDQMNLLYNAASVPSALMSAASVQQDTLCRVLGRCRHGAAIDREVGDFTGSAGLLQPRLFSYLRYNVDLSAGGLSSLGLGDIEPERVQRLDSIDYMDDLRAVGQAAAGQQVKAEHFDGF
ncbi:MAG: patatin-like phospholipase family protein [Vicinamibacterales bacterium]